MLNFVGHWLGLPSDSRRSAANLLLRYFPSRYCFRDRNSRPRWMADVPDPRIPGTTSACNSLLQSSCRQSRCRAGGKAAFAGVAVVGFYGQRPSSWLLELVHVSSTTVASYSLSACGEAKVCTVSTLEFVELPNEYRIPGLFGSAGARIQHHWRAAGASRRGDAKRTKRGEVIKTGRRHAGIVRGPLPAPRYCSTCRYRADFLLRCRRLSHP